MLAIGPLALGWPPGWLFPDIFTNALFRIVAPQAKESCGLSSADVEIEESAVDVLIKWYARESGVRNLKKYIEKVSYDALQPVFMALILECRSTARLL